MKTLGIKENFRVVIYPRRLGDLGGISCSDSFLYSGPDAQRNMERDYKERCEEIAAQALRHCDNMGSVSVEFDQESVCEHCGAAWTEKDNDYNGGCCEKDESLQGVKVRDIATEMGFPSLVRTEATKGE